ncbi:hypothetical protein ACIQU6_05180 [Streptomyces sp. NPDC090442]|uniref:hypothetical protein n=1 Tax=Streptomyces sp. NPDC090442 TaxID=3365962 RepID=UPI003828C33E
MNRLFLAPCALAAIALAAQGSFTYTPRPTTGFLQNPRPECHRDLNGNGPVDNNTNHTAELFTTTNCAGNPQRLAPGGSGSYAFQSVRFVGHGSNDGIFTYTLPSPAQTLENPQADQCINVTGRGYAVNNTDKTVLLFTRAGCPGTNNSKIPPGRHVENSSFSSIEFFS